MNPNDIVPYQSLTVSRTPRTVIGMNGNILSPERSEQSRDLKHSFTGLLIAVGVLSGLLWGASNAASQTADQLCDPLDGVHFTDISDADYASGYILCAKALGLTTGKADGTFAPNESVTRAQIATFLIRLWRDTLGKTCPTATPPFTDIANNFAQQDIICLYALGITKGATPTSFAPDATLTASQITRFLARLLNKATPGTCDLTDNELAKAAQCLVGLNIAPNIAEAQSNTQASRAQMIVYLIGAWHNATGAGKPPAPPAKPTSTTTTLPTPATTTTTPPTTPATDALGLYAKGYDEQIRTTWGWNLDGSNNLGKLSPSSFLLQYKESSANEWSTQNLTSQNFTTETENGAIARDTERAIRYQATINGLLNGIEYDIRLSIGTEAWTELSNIVPVTSTPPVNLGLLPGDNSITATWDPPINTGDGQFIEDYKLYYTSADSSESGTLETILTSATITGLKSGTQYQVMVSVRKQHGEGFGDWSAKVSATTTGTPPTPPPTPPTAPDAPGKGSILRIAGGDSYLGVYYFWGVRGAADISKREIQYRKSGSSTWESIYPEWWLKYVKITGLPNGEEYTLRLRSQNQHGWGPWSDEITGTPNATLPKPPEFVLKPGDQQITAKWRFDWGSGTWMLKDHQVQYKLANSDNWTSVTSNPYGNNAAAPVRITGLTNSSEYQVRVRARLTVLGQRDDIWSEWSDILTAIPDAKYSTPTKPSLTITDVGTGQFTISWSTNTASIYPTTLYRLEYKANTGTSNWTIARSSPTLTPSTPQTITGLTNGTTYKVRIRALNEAGWSSWSDEQTATPN